MWESGALLGDERLDPACSAGPMFSCRRRSPGPSAPTNARRAKPQTTTVITILLRFRPKCSQVIVKAKLARPVCSQPFGHVTEALVDPHVRNPSPSQVQAAVFVYGDA
ncbi:hypothetical protein HGRIS_008475 [Hohenbuehelia grisea]|uniref:Uncharacterized protein n=1 Tax=Hohenbuehelia grisea TaxID=104357 RepID=A0ABR3J8J7_9AGAR